MFLSLSSDGLIDDERSPKITDSTPDNAKPNSSNGIMTDERLYTGIKGSTCLLRSLRLERFTQLASG